MCQGEGGLASEGVYVGVNGTQDGDMGMEWPWGMFINGPFVAGRVAMTEFELEPESGTL